MNKFCAVFVICFVSLASQGAWYWPFGGKGGDPAKPRISELMEPASLLIDSAADYAESGRIEEAVGAYRKALAELDRIEYENPDRVGTPDFATVNNKRAYVDAAIDSLLLKQAMQNAKAVAISDTTELEKRYARLKGRDVPAEEPAPAAKRPVAEKPAATRNPAVGSAPAESVAPAAKPDAAGKKEAVDSTSRKARLMLALEDLRAKDYEAAKLTLKALLAEKPNDAAALNIRAAVESGMGDYKAAERTLDQAIRSNPRSHHAFYNMARLFIRTRGADGKDSARRYYEAGRTLGGPVDAELEGLLR
ncbi:MAG: hypothetical protein ACI4R9_04485 [Kiritimatiellia bacterium]